MAAVGPGQALFAIVQGEPMSRFGSGPPRRVVMAFPGYAIGGLAVGEGHEATIAMLAALPGDSRAI